MDEIDAMNEMKPPSHRLPEFHISFGYHRLLRAILGGFLLPLGGQLGLLGQEALIRQPIGLIGPGAYGISKNGVGHLCFSFHVNHPVPQLWVRPPAPARP